MIVLILYQRHDSVSNDWGPGAGVMTSCPLPGVMVLSAGAGRGPTCPGGGSGLAGLE